jgi:predicted RNase H-like nuclease (RuvC/YqgF family)
MEALGSIEEKVNKLEFIFGQGAEDIVRKVQREFLQDLYKIRESLKEDLKGQTVVSSSETDSLQKEIKNLQEENTKLHYRIKHLKQHID